MWFVLFVFKIMGVGQISIGQLIKPAWGKEHGRLLDWSRRAESNGTSSQNCHAFMCILRSLKIAMGNCLKTLIPLLFFSKYMAFDVLNSLLIVNHSSSSSSHSLSKWCPSIVLQVSSPSLGSSLNIIHSSISVFRGLCTCTSESVLVWSLLSREGAKLRMRIAFVGKMRPGPSSSCRWPIVCATS